ncbi:exopolyphosphatase [Malassezia caprae]|uniref:Exopolyphosphatase n=1 Tax=Malassezia caprae TaxID=1381934 RepID=A0AAF0IW77_9BASI|nr:exopolyphosphatase [Malassezia caprae]
MSMPVPAEHAGEVPVPSASRAPIELAAYLRWAKDQAMAHKVQCETGGTPTQPLTLIMGNEAGDLDSAASAIALSYVMNHDQAHFVRAYGVPRGVHVPVIQTPRRALSQRKENLHVYEYVQAPVASLLCVDELGDLASPAWGPDAQVSLGLVDHPQLRAAWGADRRIVAVVDHHEDEGLYRDAPLRIIRAPSTSPVGSAASLVAALAHEARRGAALETRVADLLLSAVVLDTKNLKMQEDGGKGTRVDAEAFAYLAQSTSIGRHEAGAASPDPALTAAWSRELQRIKSDVAHLDTHGLLERDLKEVRVVTKRRALQVGLASVPISLSAWLGGAYKGPAPMTEVAAAAQEHEWARWWASLGAFMEERRLDMAVVLSSYKTESKSRRDLALALRGSASELADVGQALEGTALGLKAWKGERRTENGKKERVAGVDAKGHVRSVPGIVGAVWRQGNTAANRKVVQPALLRALQRAL